MLFAAICNDKPDGLALRLETRPAHLAWIETLGTAIKGAGPFLDEKGQPNGSLLFVEASDEAACRAILSADPYAKAGLFASVEVRPWRWLIKNPEA
ncbi:MAG: YciI family protein [Hyphomicrobiales bacterium]